MAVGAGPSGDGRVEVAQPVFGEGRKGLGGDHAVFVGQGEQALGPEPLLVEVLDGFAASPEVADESCSVYTKNDTWWEAGKSFYGGTTRRAPGGSATGKSLKAIDVQTGKTAWEIPAVGGGILGSGLMATAGGLLFYGDDAGAFLAADAKNGTLLWQFNANQRSKAGPMTYTVDGTQYIGVAAGSTILAFGLW